MQQARINLAAKKKKSLTEKKSARLSTVGYQGCEIDEFVAALKSKKIKFLADVRRNPVSRKPGFAKTRLGSKLSEAGIEYQHMPALGVPTEWRKAAKAELMTRKQMFSEYRKKILPFATKEISFLRKQIRIQKTAVLCFEADATDCHRWFVAEKIARRKNIDDLDILSITRKLRTRGRRASDYKSRT